MVRFAFALVDAVQLAPSPRFPNTYIPAASAARRSAWARAVSASARARTTSSASSWRDWAVSSRARQAPASAASLPRCAASAASSAASISCSASATRASAVTARASARRRAASASASCAASTSGSRAATCARASATSDPACLISASSAQSGSAVCPGGTARPSPAAGRAALWKRREHASPQNTRVRPRPDTGTRFPQPGRLQRRSPGSPPRAVPPEGSTDSAATSVPSVMEIPFLSHQLFSSPGNERERGDREHADRDAAGRAGIGHPASWQGSRQPPPAVKAERRQPRRKTSPAATARDPACRPGPARAVGLGTGRSCPGKASRKSRPGQLPARAGCIPVPQPRHHSTQTAQACAIQDQALARTGRFRAKRFGRRRCHQARHPIGQLHLQMRHPSTCRTA